MGPVGGKRGPGCVIFWVLGWCSDVAYLNGRAAPFQHDSRRQAFPRAGPAAVRSCSWRGPADTQTCLHGLEIANNTQRETVSTVTEIYRPSDYGSEGWGFESLRARFESRPQPAE